MKSSISVAVRIRPFTEKELQSLQPAPAPNFFVSNGSFSQKPQAPPTPRGIRCILNAVDDRMLIFDPPETNPLTSMARNAFPHQNSRIREHRFVFDRVFAQHALQEDVFTSTTRPLIDTVLEGYNATVFAYGATGCGKTHTILGTPSDPGVIFLTMKELYERIERISDDKIVEVSLSYLEIYNETIRDLLCPSTDFKKLVLREDSNNKISVANLTVHKPSSVDEVMQLILSGNQNRTSSPTEANSASSRSHAVLQINVVQKDRTESVSEQHTYATFLIIDLAGSERAAATKNRGARLNEGANINKSLLALGNCINALCDPRRRNHVPYRNSKLTRLLKFLLGGNCKTVMVVCVSPLLTHYDETLNTLKYADRAKEIKTKLIRNQHNLDRHVGSYLKMITQQKMEIEELRTREKAVVEREVTYVQQQTRRNLEKVFEAIEELSQLLSTKLLERWNKYFILSKRKLLMLQRLDADSVLGHSSEVSESTATLLSQLVYKLDLQITELEAQYATHTDIEHIFESAPQVMRRLSELGGWTEEHKNIFMHSVDQLRAAFERDVLFYLSILFDYLLHELRDYSLVQALASRTLDEILGALVNGEYDAAVEEHTTEFMKQKLAEQERLKQGSAAPLVTEEDSLKPVKRVGSSLTSSPPTKKAFRDRSNNKSAGRIPTEDISMLESDVSMDDDAAPKTILENVLNIPITNTRLTHKLSGEPMSSNLPLLNKRASSKVQTSTLPSASLVSNKTHLDISPTSIMEKYLVQTPLARNIESRTDSVE